MSIKNIIQESLNKNPIGLKEALTEELRSRVAAVLESMIAEKKSDEDDEEDDDGKPYDADSKGEYDDDEDDKKSSKKGKKELDEEIEQIDEISKKTLGSYVKKASLDALSKGAQGTHFSAQAKEDPSARDKANKSFAKASKRVIGIDKAVSKIVGQKD